MSLFRNPPSSAECNTTAAAGKVTWNLGNLAGNAPKEVCVTFVGDKPGTYNFSATTRGTCAKAATTTCSTTLMGVSALLLEKAGENTTYTRESHQPGHR